MSSELPGWLRDALPEHLREEVQLIPCAEPRRLTLRFGSSVVDVSLSSETPRAFVSVGELSFGYRVDTSDERALTAALCQRVADALTTQVGEALVEWLRAREPARPEPESEPKPFGSRAPGRSVMLTDRDLGRDLRLAWLAATPITDVEIYLYEAVCVQSCQFCVFPGLRERQHTLGARADAGLRSLVRRASRVHDPVEWVARIVEILRPRPDARVVLAGPDCLRHPRIDELLELFADAREPALELLGPMTELAEPKLARRVAALAGLETVTTSLFSHRAEIHDAMVGRPGAHAEVMRALDNCAAEGIRVSINLIVSPVNVDDVPDLLALCRARELSVSLCLYHPESAYDVLRASWRNLDLPKLVVGPDALARMWAATAPASLELVAAHYVPRCWVPAELRAQILRPQDAETKGFYRKPPRCRGCSEQTRCAGITHADYEVLGPDCVTPIVGAGAQGSTT